MKHKFLAAGLFLFLQSPLWAQTAATTQRTHKRHHYKSKKTVMYVEPRKQSAGTTDEQRPSVYKGDNTPVNDGIKKNKQRNLNYNSGQALPPNSGNGNGK